MGHNGTTQFEKNINRQMCSRNNVRLGGLRTRHPGWHRQRPPIRPSHHIVDLIVTVVDSHHWKALGAQRVKGVVDRYLGEQMLMGSMSFRCSKP